VWPCASCYHILSQGIRKLLSHDLLLGAVGAALLLHCQYVVYRLTLQHATCSAITEGFIDGSRNWHNPAHSPRRDATAPPADDLIR
jgi:hypothetical protein